MKWVLGDPIWSQMDYHLAIRVSFQFLFVILQPRPCKCLRNSFPPMLLTWWVCLAMVNLFLFNWAIMSNVNIWHWSTTTLAIGSVFVDQPVFWLDKIILARKRKESGRRSMDLHMSKNGSQNIIWSFYFSMGSTSSPVSFPWTNACGIVFLCSTSVLHHDGGEATRRSNRSFSLLGGCPRV